MKEKHKTLVQALVISLIVSLIVCLPYLIGAFSISNWDSSDDGNSLQEIMGAGEDQWTRDFLFVVLSFSLFLFIINFSLLTIALYFIIHYLKEKKKKKLAQ